MSLEFQLWPHNAPFAKAIISALIAMFVFWLVWWFSLMRKISRSRRELSLCELVSRRLREGFIEGNAEDSAARNFCNEALKRDSITPDGDIGKHVCTVFLTGRRDASLQVSELNHRTIEAVAGREGPLRILLSTFVIVGLLGTLGGIANSVAAFGGDQPSTQDMLHRLSSAFTPSIYGVAFSIFGALLLAWTRNKAVAFSTSLRACTIEILIPLLVPSHSDRIDHAATRAVAAAQRVVEFAESIEVRSAAVDASLGQAAAYAGAISTAMQQMSTAVEFTANVVDDKMRDLGNHVSDLSDVLNRFAGFHDVMQQHERSLIGILGEIKSVAEQNANTAKEAAKLAQVERTDLLNAMRELNKPVKDSADEITRISLQFAQVCQLLTHEVAEASKQQTGTLTEHFTSWRTELNREAGAAKRSLDNLKVPFEQSAELLREQAALSIRQMSTINEDLKNEFSKRGGDLVTSIDSLIQPLRELAAKDVIVNGSTNGVGHGVFRLSGEDWTRIERILNSRADFTAEAAPIRSAVFESGVSRTSSLGYSIPNLEVTLGGVEAEIRNLHISVKDLSTAIRAPKKMWIVRVWNRALRRNSTS